jgi:hypothetical protein
MLYEVNGGGHTEPSIEEQYSALVELYLGRQNHDIEMAGRSGTSSKPRPCDEVKDTDINR